MRNFAHLGKETPQGIVTKFCMCVDIQDLITNATFLGRSVKGFGRGEESNFPFPVRRRPYNTRTSVRICDKMFTLYM